MFKKQELTRLGDILVSKGLITPEQLDAAIREQSRRKLLLDPLDPNVKVVPIGEVLIELGFIDRLQLKRGLNWQQRLRRASIAMALCAPFMIFSPSAAASVVRPAPITVEAEAYSTMSGVAKETTADVGGGQHVGYIDTGDWINYTNIVIPVTGQYKITYRISSLKGGASLVLKNSTTDATLDTAALPKTDSWQNWVDVERTVTLSAGAINLKVVAAVGGFNFNWFKIESLDGTVISSSSAVSSVAPVPSSAAASSVAPLPSSAAVVPSSAAASSVAAVPSSAAASSTAATTTSTSATSSTPATSSTSTTPVTTVFPFVIEAESYSSMFGVAKETTTDVGGGQALGYVDTGDWVSYSKAVLNAPFSGKYKFSYRVSSLKGGANLALNDIATNTTLDTVSIASTGGWQNWQTVEREVELTEGEHTFTLVAKTGGANINWIKIQPVAVPTSIKIEAESYAKMSGVAVETTTDVGGGKNVGYFDAGDWMSYDNSAFEVPNAATSYKVTYRVACNKAAVSMELYDLDTGAVLDTVPVPNTAGWQTWVDVERTIKLPAGKKRFGVRATKGSVNFNWFKLEPVNNAGKVIADIYIPPASSAASSSSVSSAPSVSSSSPAAVSSSSSSKAAVSSSSSSLSNSSASSAQSVAGPVGLSWAPPDKRENGEYLNITDVGGYEIRYKKATDTKYTYISITDAWTNTYNFAWLEGDYVFQIAAFDKNGVYSPFVDIHKI